MGTTKHDRMSARHALRALTMVIGLCAMALADAQDGAVREEVFAEADAVRAEAEAANTALFAPESHAEAMEYYNDASEQFERGRRLDRVTEDLAMSIRHFNTAIETTELSKLTLADAITARAAAEEAQAYREAQRTWEDAEETFEEAIEELERGRLDRARDLGGEAEALYSQAQQESQGG